jgi:hypothetical protein
MIKDEDRASDCEVRAIWNPLEEIKENFVMVYAPKATKYCRVRTYKPKSAKK